MGLDDEPTAPLALENLGTIPAHLCFSNIRNEVKRENGRITAHLNFRTNEFIAVDPYFPTKGFVMTRRLG